MRPDLDKASGPTLCFHLYSSHSPSTHLHYGRTWIECREKQSERNEVRTNDVESHISDFLAGKHSNALDQCCHWLVASPAVLRSHPNLIPCYLPRCFLQTLAPNRLTMNLAIAHLLLPNISHVSASSPFCAHKTYRPLTQSAQLQSSSRQTQATSWFHCSTSILITPLPKAAARDTVGPLTRIRENIKP